MKTQLAGEVIRASQGQQHQDSRDQKEWNLFIICIESNWFQFISFFHQPLQSQNFIQYPFTNQYLDALWGTPFANWFGAWNQQFFNKGFKKKKNQNVLGFWERSWWSKWKGINHQEKLLNHFSFECSIWRSSNTIRMAGIKEWNLSFHYIGSNWIQFISFFHQPLQSQNFIQYPFTNQYLDALWGTPFANWFGAWNQQFFNNGFKKKKIKMFWDFERNHGDPNERESILKKGIWIFSI